MTSFVRLAQPSDASAMHMIRVSVHENKLSRPDDISEASYRPYIESGSCWVVDIQYRIAGFVALDIAHGTVWALFVSPDMEGHGIGKALHETMIGAAAALGLKKIRLATETGSRAVRFYKAAGWEFAGNSEIPNEEIYELTLVRSETPELKAR